MQATTMPDIKEMEKTAPKAPAAPVEKVLESDELSSSAELTTAPQEQLNKLESDTPKQPMNNQPLGNNPIR